MRLKGTARAASQRSTRSVDNPFVQLEDETARMFSAIAEKIEREPSLLAIPAANIERWLAKGHPGAAWLTAWKSKIEMALRSPTEFAALLRLLRDSSPEAMRWKGFSPFAGVLTADELESRT